MIVYIWYWWRFDRFLHYIRTGFACCADFAKPPSWLGVGCVGFVIRQNEAGAAAWRLLGGLGGIAGSEVGPWFWSLWRTCSKKIEKVLKKLQVFWTEGCNYGEKRIRRELKSLDEGLPFEKDKEIRRAGGSAWRNRLAWSRCQRYTNFIRRKQENKKVKIEIMKRVGFE